MLCTFILSKTVTGGVKPIILMNSPLIISGEVEVNPGPVTKKTKLSFAVWNLDSLPARDFARIPLIESFQATYEFDIFGVCESLLNICYLKIEIECNLKIVNVTLNLNDGTYKPYRKPNDEIYMYTLNQIIPRTLQNRSQFPLKTVYTIYLQANTFLMKQLHMVKKHCKNPVIATNYLSKSKQIKITAPMKEGHEKEILHGLIRPLTKMSPQMSLNTSLASSISISMQPISSENYSIETT